MGHSFGHSHILFEGERDAGAPGAFCVAGVD